MKTFGSWVDPLKVEKIKLKVSAGIKFFNILMQFVACSVFSKSKISQNTNSIQSINWKK